MTDNLLQLVFSGLMFVLAGTALLGAAATSAAGGREKRCPKCNGNFETCTCTYLTGDAA